MKGTNLGEFEELVLLSVAVHSGNAYGVLIAQLIEEEAGRKVTLSTIHNALYRLEEKGFLSSAMGGATEERGGRKKRLFSITTEGQHALQEAKELRNKMWNLIPSNQ